MQSRGAQARAGGRQCGNRCGNAARKASLRPRPCIPHCRAVGSPIDEDAASTSGRAANIYAPIFRAMKATSEARSELERELFGSKGAAGAAAAIMAGGAAPTLDIRACAIQMRSAKSWRDAKDALNVAERAQGGLDSGFLTAALTTLPKLLRKQRLSDSERQEVQSATQDLVKKHLLRLMDDLDAQGLTAAAVGLAKLGYTEPLAFQELARHSVPHMQAGSMSATMLSNLAWALATAGVRPCGAWLSEFWMELEDQVDALSGQDIANIFWSICRLELMPPWVANPGSVPLLVAALQRVGCTPSGQDPATVMVCLAIWSRSYSYHAPEELLAEMLASMQPHLPHYLPQDLVSIVHSLVVLNASPSRAWMTDFYTVLRDRLIFDPTLSLADFQRLLWALSRIDFVPSQAWLRQFVEVSIVKLRHLRFRALSELVWALACWGYTPTQEWLDEYFRCTLHKLQEYKTQHLANSILALKKLGCKVPSPWLDAALVSFCAQLEAAQAHDLITFIDGIVDVCDDAAWMSRSSTAQRLRSLAAYAASKFDICDGVMHAKLLIALATAKCCPGPAWLSAQQDSFGRSLVKEEPGALDMITAGNVRAAYAAWDVPLSGQLGAALGEISSSEDSS